MRKIFTLSMAGILLSIHLFSQPAPARFGKIDQADLEMKVYAQDTSAEAVILCDYGEFDPNNFNFTRLLRTKILKKAGTDLVNKVIYVDGTAAIRGCTYNLKDGVVVESKLKNESIFKEEVIDGHWRYRVTMPDVQVGSVVELQYSFPLLPGEWRFQDEIPVRWSELRISNSPYINFQKVFYGFQPLYINDTWRWVGKDMPALRKEPYINSISNYLTKVEIELTSITAPGYYKFYTSSWDAVNKYLLDHKRFGQVMSMTLVGTDEVKAIKAMNLQDVDKMKAACEMVKKSMKWNEEESLYATNELSFMYKKGSGNCADVNLALVVILKKLGFEAFPIALSTRDNGLLSFSYPTIDKFNYVIAGVLYNNKYYYFDATELYLPAGMLPFRALNGRGRIIDYKNSSWVDLAPAVDKKEMVYCDMKLNENAEITGKITYTDTDYGAYFTRNGIKSYNSADEYVRDLESSYPGLAINSYSFENLDSLSKPVKELYDVNLTGYADLIGDMISVSPMLIEKMETNPFKLETRKFPIDYGYATKSKYIANILIPEGYEIAEMPKPCSIIMPDKSARFTYNVILNNNLIQVVANFDINNTLYIESQYLMVKEFYNQVIAKEKEVIMLKKKTI